MSIELTLEGVRVTLGGNEILHGVSIDVSPGEFLTLLGPSGSGKTTTLNVVAGLVPLTDGHVRFDGKPVDKRPAHDRDIGLVFQSYALFPHMTVGENIAFPLMTRRVPTERRRQVVNEMLELVQLGGAADRKIASLSGGQQQRVALARALAPSPSVLLLDEPMAALDKQLRDTMQIEVRRIQSEVGVTTVAVTHDQTEAMTMSDRIAIMCDGRLEQIDTPECLYRRPATLFTARFLGEANLVGVHEGRLAGFGLSVAQQTGTAVLRPEDFCLATEAPSLPRLPVRTLTTSFQGSRYRLDVQPEGQERMIVTLPPTVDASQLVPGSMLDLALRRPESVHVIPNVVAAGAPASDPGVAIPA